MPSAIAIPATVAAATPIATIVLLMIGRQWSAARAGGVGLVIATVVAFGMFGFGRTVYGALGPGPALGGVVAEAAWVAATHGIRPSSALYHAVVEKRHLATPDGVVVDGEGRIVLAEIKTTNKAWRSIPKTYMRQIWWQQHVLGAERTLVAWEQHDGFVPMHDEPRCQWVDRDEREIAKLVGLATSLIDELYRRTMEARRPAPARQQPTEMYRALALLD